MATNKQYSYPRVTMIQINVQPVGKIRYTRHVCFPWQSTYTTRTLSTGSPHTWQPFASHQQYWADSTTPEKKGSQHNSQHATQFLSQDNHWSSDEIQASIDNMLHRFIGPITPACDWYIQYLLTGANPSVLNRHRRGLQPWRCLHAASHFLTIQTDSPPLST
jgi:hypothetical protein